MSRLSAPCFGLLGLKLTVIPALCCSGLEILFPALPHRSAVGTRKAEQSPQYSFRMPGEEATEVTDCHRETALSGSTARLAALLRATAILTASTTQQPTPNPPLSPNRVQPPSTPGGPRSGRRSSVYLLDVLAGQQHGAAGLRALVVGGPVALLPQPFGLLPPAPPVAIGAGPPQPGGPQGAGRPPAHRRPRPPPERLAPLRPAEEVPGGAG